MFCRKCGKQTYDDAVMCPSCGCYIITPKEVKVKEESVVLQWILGIISMFLFPFPLIAWIVLSSYGYKKLGRACGVGTLIGLCIFVFIFIGMCSTAMSNAMSS